MRIYSRMFSQEHSHTFTYFGATSVFTGCSNLDLVAIFLWRDKTKEEERNKDVIPTLWRAAKNASTVMVSCPVPVSCSSNTPMWMMQVRANPQWLSINFHCQHDLRVYSNKKWIVVVYDKDKKKKRGEDKFLLSPFVSVAFSESFSFSRACFREPETFCCNLTIGSSAL